MERLIRMTKNFVFTSAGDHTKFTELWCSEYQNYDIFVIYYGNSDENYLKYEKLVHSIERRKGSKFQNFYYFFKTYPEIIDKYERFFILDDDIEITSKDINRMFEISETYDLLICAPSFTKDSKICHKITINKPGVLLEYTNFIEVNTPLYNKEALQKLMEKYNPILIGWGVDYLSMWANGIDKPDKYVIVHQIQCLNPKDLEKGVRRELFLIPDADKREKTWYRFAHRLKCPIRYNHIVHKQILLPATGDAM